MGAQIPGAQGWGLFPGLAPLPSSGSELFSELCRLCPSPPPLPPMCSGSQFCLEAPMGGQDLPSPQSHQTPSSPRPSKQPRAVAENPSWLSQPFPSLQADSLTSGAACPAGALVLAQPPAHHPLQAPGFPICLCKLGHILHF